MPTRKTVILSASEDRLEALIHERLKAGADRAHIDQRIWDLFGEYWCVMFTDLAGFSRNVAEFGIVHFLQTIYESERILIPVIEDHDGILLKIEGDSLLVIFRNVNKALLAAKKMQHVVIDYNRNRSDEEKILLCVGLGYGHVLRIGDTDVYGTEVNAASKLGEDTAKAYEILVTEAVKERATEVTDINFEEIPFVPPGARKAYRVIYYPSE